MNGRLKDAGLAAIGAAVGVATSVFMMGLVWGTDRERLTNVEKGLERANTALTRHLDRVEPLTDRFLKMEQSLEDVRRRQDEQAEQLTEALKLLRAVRHGQDSFRPPGLQGGDR